MLWLALRQPRGRLGRVGGTVAESASPGGLVLAGGGFLQKTGSLAGASGWESSSVNNSACPGASAGSTGARGHAQPV